MSTIAVTHTNTNSASRVVGAARLHYVMDTWLFVWAPLVGYVGLSAVFLIIAGVAGSGVVGSRDSSTGLGLIMTILMLMQGYQSVTRLFGLSQAFGLTRREYLAGAWAVGVIGAAVLSSLLTVMGVIERATGGYGLGVRLAYSPFVFDHGEAAALTTWFIVLLGAFLAGLLFSAVRQRFGVLGTWIVYLGILALAIVAAALIGYLDAWPQVGNWVGRVGPFGVALWAIPLEIVVAVATYLILRRTPA